MTVKIKAADVTVGQHVLTNDGFYGEVLAIRPIPTDYLDIKLLVTIAGGKPTRRSVRMTHTIRRDGNLYVEEA